MIAKCFAWKLPQERYLTGFLAWILFGIVTKLGHDVMYLNESRLTALAASAMAGFVYSYMFGSIWSDFGFVSYLSVALAGFIGAVIIYRAHKYRAAAQWALLALLILTMFTLWLEPFLTVSGVAFTVLGLLLKLPMFFVDIGFTLAWVFMIILVSDQIDAELKIPDTPLQPSIDADGN